MRFGKFFLFFCLTTVSALPMVAGAQPYGPVTLGAGSALPLPLLIVLRKVDLTSDQQAKLHQIMGASFTQAQPLMKQLHAIHDQIADKLLSSGAVTASDIAPLQQQENTIHQSLDQQMLSTALQIRGLLTTQQLAKAADLHNQLKATMAQMDSIVGEAPPMGPPVF
jgi:Spy/CpxP family protein refolding chaperone